ncbi:MAG: TlpA disulfide reductase family protein [Myxococcota bacterium]|nr:TlpA disulfide reductase family protein [Myxococcota bacterium]
MKMLKHRLLIMATALLIASPSVAKKKKKAPKKAAPAAEKIELLPVGAKAPHFTLKPINRGSIGVGLGDPTANRFGATVLKKLVGKKRKPSDVKLVVLSFYATWCKSCQKEVPYLNELTKELAPKGLRSFVIAVDKGGDGKKLLDAKLAEGMGPKKTKIEIPIFHDGFNILQKKFKAAALPTVYMINAEGKIVFTKHGFNEKKGDKKKLRAAVLKGLGS